MKKQILNKAVFRYFSFGVYCCCPMLQAAFITSHTHTYTHTYYNDKATLSAFSLAWRKNKMKRIKKQRKRNTAKKVFRLFAHFFWPRLLSHIFYTFLAFFCTLSAFFPPAQRNIIFKKQHSQNQMSTRVFSRPEEVREKCEREAPEKELEK